jgi:hypothetical protein
MIVPIALQVDYNLSVDKTLTICLDKRQNEAFSRRALAARQDAFEAGARA